MPARPQRMPGQQGAGMQRLRLRELRLFQAPVLLRDCLGRVLRRRLRERMRLQLQTVPCQAELRRLKMRRILRPSVRKLRSRRGLPQVPMLQTGLHRQDLRRQRLRRQLWQMRRRHRLRVRAVCGVQARLQWEELRAKWLRRGVRQLSR